MNATARRARAAQLHALADAQSAFVLVVLKLVDVCLTLAGMDDDLADESEQWRPRVHAQDALLGVLAHHLDGDGLTAARLDRMIRVDGEPVCYALVALARELEEEARLQDTYVDVVVSAAERADATGYVLSGLEAQAMAPGSVLVRCDEVGEPVAGSRVLVMPRNLQEDRGSFLVGDRDALRAMRFLVVRDGATLPAGGAR